jgi:C_GCAxxG_C_C family probable redox protein
VKEDAMRMPVLEKASEMYRANYNCVQALMCAYCPVTGMKEEQALKLGASFGGGMGSLGEVCGALTGGFMVVGLMNGYTDPDGKKKQSHNAVIQEMAKKFKEKFGSIHCRDLLWRNVDDGSNKKEEKPCLKYVEAGIEITNRALNAR